MTEQKQVLKDYELFKKDLQEKWEIFERITIKYRNDAKYSFAVKMALEAFQYILNGPALKRFYDDRKQYEDPLPGFQVLLSKMRGIPYQGEEELLIPSELEKEINHLIVKLKSLT